METKLVKVRVTHTVVYEMVVECDRVNTIVNLKKQLARIGTLPSMEARAYIVGNEMKQVSGYYDAKVVRV